MQDEPLETLLALAYGNLAHLKRFSRQSRLSIYMRHHDWALDVLPEIEKEPAPPVRASVLIVEDEALIAADLETRLCDLGYRVSAIAASGEEALRTIEDSVPDLVLMDINIRGASDGIQVADLVRRRYDIPVVFLTAYQNRETLERAKNTAPFGYLIKPVRDGSLVSSIEIARYRHQMEQKLREREAWLTTTLTCAADGVIVTDRTARIQFSNDHAKKLLGLADQDIIGRKLSSVVQLKSKITDAPAGDLFTLVVLQGTTMDIGKDLVLDCPAGEIKEIEGELALCQIDQVVVGTVFTFRDVTIRNRQDDQKCQELRTHAVARLAGAVTNDLRHLFETILDQSDKTLVRAPEDHSGLTASIGQIKKKAEAGCRITDQLARVSQGQFLFPKSADLNALVAGISQNLQPDIPTRIELNTRFDPAIGNVLLDPNQIEPALGELIRCLRDCIPQEGRIQLTTESVDFEKHGREGTVERFVRLTITGNGPNTDQAKAAAIADQFSAAKAFEGGLDLKFFFIHNAIASAKGSIRVETGPHLGIKCDVLLPEYKAENAGAICSQDSKTREPKQVVLLVEEEFSVRILLANALISAGYEVLGARSGEEALDWNDLHAESIDLLILPSTVSVDRIFSERINMKVLIVADESAGHSGEFNLPGREVRVLAKPFQQEKLLQTIQEMFRPN